MLAEFPTAGPNETALVLWIISAVGALMLLDRVLTFYKVHIRGNPPNDHLDFSFKEHERRIANLEKIAEDQDGRRRAVYEKIEQLRREMRADIDAQNNVLRHMPGEIVALLKNAR